MGMELKIYLIFGHLENNTDGYLADLRMRCKKKKKKGTQKTKQMKGETVINSSKDKTHQKRKCNPDSLVGSAVNNVQFS